MAEQLLTLAEVAHRAGFSAATIRKHVQAGTVAHVRSDGTKRGHIRFTEAQYLALVDKLTVAPTPPPPARQRKARRR